MTFKWIIPIFVATAIMTSCSKPSLLSTTPSSRANTSSQVVESQESSIEEVPVVLLMQYIMDELSPDLYSNFEGIDNTSMNIWCVNEEKVKTIIENYNGPKVDVSYYPAKYSQSLLKPYFNEIADLPFFIDNMEHLMAISITGEGIEILVNSKGDFPEVFDWLESYDNKQYVYINEPDSEVANNNEESEPVIVEPYIPPNTNVQDFQSENPIEHVEVPFFTYLNDKLSPDDYSHWQRADNCVTIWCTNTENVKQVVNSFKDKHNFTIIYMDAKYPRSTLQKIISEMEKEPLLSDTKIVLGISISENGVQITVNDLNKSDEIFKWHSNYDNKKYVVIEELKVLPPTNPS